MKSKGLNDNKVTENLSLSMGLIGKSRKEGRDLSKKVVAQILDFYKDIERVWLMTGVGEMLKPDSTYINSEEKIKAVLEPKPQNNAKCALCGEKDARIKDKDDLIVEKEIRVQELKLQIEEMKGQVEFLKHIIETQCLIPPLPNGTTGEP